MNTDQVIKAIECCNVIGGCKACPYAVNGKADKKLDCGERMTKDAATLLRGQAGMIKGLKNALDTLKSLYTELESTADEWHRSLEMATMCRRVAEEHWKKLSSELESEKAYSENIKKENIRLRERLEEEVTLAKDQTIADTIKAMQDKLKATFCPDAHYCGYDIHAAINAKAKEMLEDL